MSGTYPCDAERRPFERQRYLAAVRPIINGLAQQGIDSGLVAMLKDLEGRIQHSLQRELTFAEEDLLGEALARVFDQYPNLSRSGLYIVRKQRMKDLAEFMCGMRNPDIERQV